MGSSLVDKKERRCLHEGGVGWWVWMWMWMVDSGWEVVVGLSNKGV